MRPRLLFPGQTVTPVTFGAMHLAQDPHDGVSRVLLHALERGVTSIDTARAYGGSEAIIGATLKAWRGPRPLIATKVQPLPSGDWRFPGPVDSAFTPASIRASCEASLQALGVEVLDVLYLHQWCARWTHEPAWHDTLTALKREGKVCAIGISAQDFEHDALLPAVDAGLIDVVQVIHTVFDPRSLVSLVPWCAARGIGVVARCVLDDGGLAVEDRDLETIPRVRRVGLEAYRLRRQLLREASGLPLPELAARFALTDPGITTLTLSMRSVEQVDQNLAAIAQGPLPDDLYQTLLRRHVWIKNAYYQAPWE